MEVTITFTVFLSLFMIVLAVRVLDLRGSPVTKFFHKRNREIDPNDLERAIRGHGNLIEYAPLFLILMLALELSDASVTLLYTSGIIFTLGMPRVKIIPDVYNNVTDASLNSSANIKIKNKGAYSIKFPWPRIALSRSFGSISLLRL